MRALLNFALFVAILSSVCTAKPFLCYWGEWGVQLKMVHRRSTEVPSEIDKIPANLCTHVIYTAVGLDEQRNTVEALEGVKDSDLRDLRELKGKNPALNIMVAIGDYVESVTNLHRMMRNTSSIDTFVASVKKLVESYGLDGCDLLWIFPEDDDSSADAVDKMNAVILLQKLRTALQSKLLTISVEGAGYKRSWARDVANFAENVDFINVMSFNLLENPTVTANHVKLLGGQFSVSRVMQTWHEFGAPKDKLVMGIAFYGRGFVLQDSRNHDVGARAIVSWVGGSNFYDEICENMRNNGWKRVFDNATKSPYVFGGFEWVGYEDVESIEYKTDLISKEGYAGAIAYTIGFDDQTGVCGEGEYPLAHAVSRGLAKQECDPAEELIPHTSRCSKFIHCVSGRRVEMSCPEDLIFDNSRKACNWPFAVDEKLPVGCPDPLG